MHQFVIPEEDSPLDVSPNAFHELGSQAQLDLNQEIDTLNNLSEILEDDNSPNMRLEENQ